MLKRVIVYALVFSLIGQQAFAGASCGCVKSAAMSNAQTISAAVKGAASSIVGSLNSLLRDNKGMNVAQAVRESQATASQDAAAIAKQVTAALDAHQASMIAYEQRREALEDARQIEARIPAVTPDECASYSTKQSSPLAQATQAAYSAAAGNTGRSATGGVKTVYQAAQEMTRAREADPRALDAGIVLRPGCTPKMSEETAYAAKLPVVGSYECPAPNLTIPKEDAEKAASFVARMVVPHPIPELPMNVRGTPAGVLYEAERDIVRMRQSYLIDVAQDSLSKFLPTRNIADNKEYFTLMGVDRLLEGGIPDDVSEMDYLRYHLLSRWDNPEYQKSQKNKDVGALVKDLNESVLLLASIQFRQLELAEKKTPAEMQFFEAVQGGPSRTKLEDLRQKAGL